MFCDSFNRVAFGLKLEHGLVLFSWLMKIMIKESTVFFKEFLRAFETTGSVIPSSRFAAEALTSRIRSASGPQSILEVGPGTGSVTRRILSDMRDNDSLTLCEINPRMMKALKAGLESNPHFIRHRERITFFEGPVQDLPEEKTFDTIICAIPFNNLTLEIVQDIFQKLKRLSHENTYLSFFEYLALRELNMVMAPSKRRKRMKQIEKFFDQLNSSCPTTRKIVWLNFTPINIYTMKLKAAA